MPDRIHSMYFIFPLFAAIYIRQVSTGFAGTQYRLNYGVYSQTLHPAVQLVNKYILGSINISLPSPPIVFDLIKDPCKTFLERSTADHHHIHACRRILATTPDISLANLHHNTRTRRSSSGLLPFIGEISKVLFGTATENDVRNQQVGIERAIQVGSLDARELNTIGNALKKNNGYS